MSLLRVLLLVSSLAASLSFAAEQEKEIVGYYAKGKNNKICFVGIDADTLKYYATFPMKMFSRAQVDIMSKCQKDKVSKNAYISITRLSEDSSKQELGRAFFIVHCKVFDTKEGQNQLLEVWREVKNSSNFTKCL